MLIVVTQQYHTYYRGKCGTYINEGSLDTNCTEYTLDTNCTEYAFDELQESINYTFTVNINQTGFVEGDLSTGPVYAKPYLLN